MRVGVHGPVVAARALFEVPGAAEALADACGQCVSSETIGDDVRSTALEVLASLLEAAAYWRRAFSYTLAEAVEAAVAYARYQGSAGLQEEEGKLDIGEEAGSNCTRWSRGVMLDARASVDDDRNLPVVEYR